MCIIIKIRNKKHEMVFYIGVELVYFLSYFTGTYTLVSLTNEKKIQPT